MIVVDQVSRTFQSGEIVLDHISFYIPRGEFVGLIGLNGTGKSTLLRILTGVIAQTSGNVRVNGFDPMKYHKKLIKTMTAIFENFSSLIEDATVEENFRITKMIYGMSNEFFSQKFEQLDQMLKLRELFMKTKEELSIGESKRVEFGLALLPEAQVIFLDEAMIGMDSMYKKNVLQYLKLLCVQKNITVVMSSHQMEELKGVCSRVMVLHQHKIQYYGTIEQLERKYANYSVIKIILQNGIPDMEDLAIHSYALTQNELTIVYNRNRISSRFILNHILQQSTISDFVMEDEGLEKAVTRLFDYLSSNQISEEWYGE